jgi:hypothetical protein
MSLHAIVKSSFDRLARRCPRHAAACALLLTLGASHVAGAHQASITHSTVEIGHDQTELTYRIKFEPPDLSEVLGLGVDVDPPDQAVSAGQDRLLDFVLQGIEVQGGERACPVERMGAQVVRQGGRFVEVAFRVRCPEPFAILVIDYDLFFDLDPIHRGLLQVRYRDQRAVAELKSDAARFVWELDEPPPGNRLGFVASGVEHILFGFDHIAFLLGLLLVVAIARAPGPAPGWQRRGLGSGLRYTAIIVTSFTVAHSITLIAASLDWISLDSRLVESVIAASIVYVAVEDILKPDVRHRAVLTFCFGLVHGLGFASMLKVLLPPEDVIWPLLMFNVGVELGQLAIVLLVLPVLHVLTRVMGADIYRTRLLPIGAGVLAVLGALWLVERVLDVTLLGF